ncbi:hypothetical protein ACF3NW_02080 [Eikenella halliae]|uniref:hypothetical protein n=1 Tax=Eikenella halliae TaxID=1795832 RepID=UPI0028D8E604|nr:hypothetical protein [Eikenella halliae]
MPTQTPHPAKGSLKVRPHAFAKRKPEIPSFQAAFFVYNPPFSTTRTQQHHVSPQQKTPVAAVAGGFSAYRLSGCLFPLSRMNTVSGRHLKPNPKTPFSEQIAKQPIYGTLCRKRKLRLKHLVSRDGLVSILNGDTVWAT